MLRPFSVAAMICMQCSLLANNIQVSNISLTGQDIIEQTIFVEFDLSWENSWRVSSGPANWDAAWVFVKFRKTGGQWNHMNINYVDGTNDGHVAAPGSTIRTVAGGTGCFIYRDSDGNGNNNFSNIQLLWQYDTTGVGDDDLVEIKVFAIEMVYVPEAPFDLGTGALGTEVNDFYLWPIDAPYTISSESAIAIADSPGELYYENTNGNGGDQQGPILDDFPKGYAAFYCMKYEVSQGQWVAFFNTLTEAQKINHDLTDASHKNSDGIVGRNAIAWASGFATTEHPDIPVNYIAWQNIAAYLDWAGLRPMTELEYEKACRGNQPPVPDEFAWGSSEIPNPASPYVLINAGTPHELISNKLAEEAGVAYSPTTIGIGGPLRCGIHAASAINKNRTESGGSYYGIMELSGNMNERAVSVGTPDGRAFTGEHGDGQLDGAGLHNVSNWPLGNTGGYGYRGGAYSNGSTRLRVSDRYFAASLGESIGATIGFRGVRTE